MRTLETAQLVGQGSRLPMGRLAPGPTNWGETPRAAGQRPAPLHERRRKLLLPPKLLITLSLSVAAASAQTGWLDQLDESLFLQSPNGFFRTDFSGLFDLEGYYIDQRPPGLIFGGDEEFVNPRLSLFLDTRLGKHFYSLVEGRIDRGFDPRSRVRDARFDQYLLRYTPFEDSRVNLQVGKFGTVVGNWVARHDSWNNAFLNAPVPYENVFIISDHSAPGSRAAFLARRDQSDKKDLWRPIIWGPSYATGAALFGALKDFDYAFEVKNAALSSRPRSWDGRDFGWENPTVNGRIGYRPNAAWNLGASFGYGTYLLPEAERGATFPAGKGIGDYDQITLAHDISYAWRHWQLWGEVFLSRFEVPNVGNADTLAYYLETKYKFTTHLFGAVRWNQQFFAKVNDGLGGQTPWDRDLWRVDAAVGYRFNRHLQAKAQYSYSHQQGPVQQGEQLAALQVTLKF